MAFRNCRELQIANYFWSRNSCFKVFTLLGNVAKENGLVFEAPV